MVRPLLQKLGWKVGLTGSVLNCPIDLQPAFEPVQADLNPSDLPLDWQLYFCISRHAIEGSAEEGTSRYHIGGHLWFAYHKKRAASKLTSTATTAGIV